MSDLPVLPVRAEFGMSRIERRASREISRYRAGGLVAAAREIAKVEKVAQVTEAALLATSHISAIEALLIERTPHAESRLRHIADAGCAGMANVVLRTGSDL